MKPRSPRPLRILLAGDDAGFTRLIDQLVAEEAGLTVDLASSDHLSKGLDELAGKSADVILLALSRPNRDGLQLLAQTYEQAPGIPIVVLMQRDDAKFAERALDGGAHDVLVKGQVDNRGLIRSLRYAVERKVLEQALSESEDRFRLLVEHAQDLIYRYRLVPTPGFDYISPAALSITGYTPEEFYADPRLPFRLVHPADHDQLLARQQSRARHLPWVQTFRLRKKDGMVIWAEEQITPILDTTGNPIAFEGVIRDISERKRVEEERERLREEWTSIIAHDLRQPLMVIEGYAGLLKYELGDDGTELTLWANSIQTSVSRLNRMIVDLLDASRIEAKRLET